MTVNNYPCSLLKFYFLGTAQLSQHAFVKPFMEVKLSHRCYLRMRMWFPFPLEPAL